MFADEITSNDIDFIVENLCDKAIEELKIIFGNDYKNKTAYSLKTVPKENIKVVKLKNNNEPVAIFGIVETNKDEAGVFFVSTDNLYKGNMIHFLKGSKQYINKWNEKYNLIDECYKENESVIKWLKLLGFEQTDIDGKYFYIFKRVKK